MDTLLLASQDFYKFQMMNIFVVVAGVVTLLGILLGVVHSMYKTRQTEQSRREIAAYVAEGSMSPEDAERLLTANNEKPWSWGCGSGKPGSKT